MSNNTPERINHDLYYGQHNKRALGITLPAGNSLTGYTWTIVYTRSANDTAPLLTISNGNITKNTTDVQVEWTITPAQMLSTFDRTGAYWWHVQAVSDSDGEERIVAMGTVNVIATGDTT